MSRRSTPSIPKASASLTQWVASPMAKLLSKSPMPQEMRMIRRAYRRLVALAAELGRTYAVVAEGPRAVADPHGGMVLPVGGGDSGGGRRFPRFTRRPETCRARTCARTCLTSDSSLSANRRARLNALAPRTHEDALDLSSVPDLPAERLAALAEAFAADFEALANATAEAAASYPLDAVRRMPLDQLDADWREAQTKIWPVSAFARKRVRKLLQTYADRGTADPAVDLNALLKMRERDAALRESSMAPVADTGNGPNADRSTEVAHQAIAFREAVANLRTEAEDSIRFDSATAELGSASGGRIRDALSTFLAAEEVAAEKQRGFTSRGGDIPAGTSVADLDAGLATIAAERARLADWARWVEKSKGALAAGLGPLVEALESGAVEGGADEAFERAYAAWWLPPRDG